MDDHKPQCVLSHGTCGDMINLRKRCLLLLIVWICQWFSHVPTAGRGDQHPDYSENM